MFLKRFLPKPEIQFFTRVPIGECRRRLSDALGNGRRWGWGFFHYQPGITVDGWIWGSRFIVHKRIYYRNSFLPVFYGKLTSTPHGIYVSGSFGLHPLVILFLFVWVGMVGNLLVGSVLAAISSGVSLLEQPFHLIPVGVLLFAIAITGFGWWLERSAKDHIRKFLHRLLIPVEVKPAPAVHAETKISWKYIVVCVLLGWLLMLPRTFLSISGFFAIAARDPATREVFYSLFLHPLVRGLSSLGYIAPLAVAVLFVWLSTRPNPRVHPFTMVSGALIISLPLSLVAAAASDQWVSLAGGLIDGARFAVEFFQHLLIGGIISAAFSLFGAWVGWLFFAEK